MSLQVTSLYTPIIITSIIHKKGALSSVSALSDSFIYLIDIVLGFLDSGTILSKDTFKRPSFNSAPLTSTSSAIVKDFEKYLLAIPLWITPSSSLSLVASTADLIFKTPSSILISISFLLKPASASSIL